MLDYLIDGQWYQAYGEMAVPDRAERTELQPGAVWEKEIMSLCYDHSQALLLPGSYRILAEIKVDGQSYHLADEIEITGE